MRIKEYNIDELFLNHRIEGGPAFEGRVEFKELLGEDELSSLIYPPALNFDYTNDFVKSKFISSAEDDDLIFPLITHSKNMRYKDNEYKDHITDTYLSFSDLKPALKTKVILKIPYRHKY